MVDSEGSRHGWQSITCLFLYHMFSCWQRFPYEISFVTLSCLARVFFVANPNDFSVAVPKMADRGHGLRGGQESASKFSEGGPFTEDQWELLMISDLDKNVSRVTKALSVFFFFEVRFSWPCSEIPSSAAKRYTPLSQYAYYCVCSLFFLPSGVRERSRCVGRRGLTRCRRWYR